jgi:hypothetical protein
MGLSPCAEAIRKKRGTPGRFKLFWKTRRVAATRKTRRKKAQAKCVWRNGFVSGVARSGEVEFAVFRSLGKKAT